MAQLFHKTRNTERFRAWLTANGIDIERVPEDATIYVKDDQLWFEEFVWRDDGSLWVEPNGKTRRTTKWVFHSVRIEDI